MMERVTSDTLFARVLRIVLVFVLVTWSTFHVEAIAYAMLLADNGSEHEAGTLANIEVWELDKTDATRLSSLVRDVRDTAAPDKPQTKTVELEAAGTMQFVAVPIWATPVPQPVDEKTSATVRVVWDDADNQDDIRPADLKITLSNDQEVVLNADNGWEATIADLPKFENGSEIIYTWTQDVLPGGYETTYSIEGTVTTFTNTHVPTVEPEPVEPDPEPVEPDPQPDPQPNPQPDSENQQVSPAATKPMPAAVEGAQSLSVQADEPVGEKDSEEKEPDVIIADFVKWEVNDEKIATVQVKDGVATLTAKAEGTVKVTCSLDTKKYPELANLPVATFATEFPEKPFEVTFEVTVKPAEQQKPYVHSIGVYTPDSSSGATPISHVNADDPLIIPDDQAASYALREKVSAVLDPSAVDEPPVVYDCSSTKGLSAASGGRFADLTWRADNADGTEASKSDITVENGVITLKGKETYAVWCISPDGPEGKPYETHFYVRLSSAKEDPQGVSNPQNELTVEIDVPETTSQIDDEAADADASGAESASPSGSSNGDGMKTQAEGDVPSGSASSASSSASASSSSASADKKLKSTSKTYNYKNGDLEPFTIKNASGEPDEYTMSSPAGELKVKGAGPTLAALIYDAADPKGELGLSPAANPIDIESVEFVIAGGKSVTVPWADLVSVSAPNNVILASQSLVVTNDGTGLKVSAVEDEGEGGPTGTGSGADAGAGTEAGTGGGADAGAGTETGTGGGADAGAGTGADAGAGAGAGTGTETGAGTEGGTDAGAGTGADTGTSTGTEPGGSGAGSGGTSTGGTVVAGLLDNTRFRLLYNGSGKGELADPDSFRYINKVIVHVKGAKPEPVPEIKSAYVAYTPVRKGEVAYLVPQFTLPDSINGGSVEFHYDWQWSTDNATWSNNIPSSTDKDRGQQLEVLTNDESIGTYRRFILTVTRYDGATGEKVEDAPIESSSVKIEVGSGFRVKLDYVPPVAGDVANFTAIPEIDPDDPEKIDKSQIYYEWQMSTDYGQTWIGEGNPEWPELLKSQSGVQSTTLRIPTKKIEEKQPTTDEAGKDGEGGEASKKATQLTWIRVVAHYNGKKTPSDPVPLTVHVGDTSGGKKADQIQEELNKGQESKDDSGDQTPTQPSTPSQSQTQVTELDNIVFEEPVATGVGPTPTPTPSQVYVNDAVTEQIAQQEQAVQEQANAKPGARWTELSSINPTDEDVQNILSVNPLAPFAAPMALGVTAAGAIEKLLVFRRQTK